MDVIDEADERKRQFEVSEAQEPKRMKPEDIVGPMDDKRCTTRLLLTKHEFSKIIGKGGATISHIRASCGASVKGTDVDNDGRLLIVSGSPRQVLECFDIVTDLMYQSYTQQTCPVEPFTVQLLLEHTKQAGRVVGPKGATISALKTKSGASQIRLLKEPKDYHSVLLRQMSIEGQLLAVRRAHYCLVELFVDPALLQGFGDGGGPFGSGSGSNGGKQWVPLPLSSLISLGVQAETVRQLNEMKQYLLRQFGLDLTISREVNMAPPHLHAQQGSHAHGHGHGHLQAHSQMHHHAHSQLQQHAQHAQQHGQLHQQQQQQPQQAVAGGMHGHTVFGNNSLMQQHIIQQQQSQPLQQQQQPQQISLSYSPMSMNSTSPPVSHMPPHAHMLQHLYGGMGPMITTPRAHSPDECTFLIPSVNVGGVIGKGGQTLKDLQLEFGLRIYVEKETAGPPSSAGMRTVVLAVANPSEGGPSPQERQAMSLCQERIMNIIAANNAAAAAAAALASSGSGAYSYHPSSHVAPQMMSSSSSASGFSDSADTAATSSSPLSTISST